MLCGPLHLHAFPLEFAFRAVWYIIGVVRPLTTKVTDRHCRIPTTHAPLRADQRPLYAQASEALKDLVQRNGYAAGDRLPSEIELSQRLGISRPTLREALRHLEEDGVIVRRHGVGTFVTEAQPVIEAGSRCWKALTGSPNAMDLARAWAKPES